MSKQLILGVTRKGDDARAAVTGLIHREGDRLKWTALSEDTAPDFFRLVSQHNKPVSQGLERIEFTVSGSPRFLFRQPDGKLLQDELKDKLVFSEAKKALLTPQQLQKPVSLQTLCLEYLEVSRLSDVMRKEMLGGERSQGQLANVLGLKPQDATLSETLWELARQRFLTVHSDGPVEDNAIGLNRPIPGI